MNFDFDFILKRIWIGLGIITGLILLGWLARFLVMILIAAGVGFLVGDWAIYVYDNRESLVKQAKEALAIK